MTSKRQPYRNHLNAQVEWVPLGSLAANPKNPRTHSKNQIQQIAASIRQFGFLNPLIVDGANVVLAGHGRLEAARREGWTEAPILRFDHLTETQKRAYVIADNKIAEQAGWDREILALELGELIDLLPTEDLDVALTGFEAAEIDQLMADLSTARPADTFMPPPSDPVTVRGDLWLLGKHRLLCGDAPRKVSRFRKADGRQVGRGRLLRSALQRSRSFDRRPRPGSPLRVCVRIGRDGAGAIFGGFYSKRSAMARARQRRAPS